MKTYEQINYIVCPLCHEEHDAGEVKAINIEEGDMGQDVLTYLCPYALSAPPQKSTVYRKR